MLKSSKTWTPLEKGDLVDIVAPGMPPRSGVLTGIDDFLGKWGLQARVPKKLLGKDLICANTREQRLHFLKEALSAPDSKMIWCLRGGYGSFQLLADLKKMKTPQTPKLLLGLSDVTSLHSFVNQNWGWSSIHGCNLDRFALNEASPAEDKRLRDVLFGKKQTLKYNLKPLNEAAKQKRTRLSSVVGGNLITLQASFGTPFQIQTKGKLLFLEDIGERAYRVDRVLEQMHQLGLFKGLYGILFGQFTGGQEPGGQSLVPKLLKQFAQTQRIPVFSGLSIGHGPNQHPLPLATPAKLFCGAKPSIEIKTGARDLG